MKDNNQFKNKKKSQNCQKTELYESDNQGVFKEGVNIHPDCTTAQQHGLPCPGEYQRLHPLQCNRCAETKKYGPNERTDLRNQKKN